MLLFLMFRCNSYLVADDFFFMYCLLSLRKKVWSDLDMRVYMYMAYCTYRPIDLKQNDTGLFTGSRFFKSKRKVKFHSYPGQDPMKSWGKGKHSCATF